MDLCNYLFFYRVSKFYEFGTSFYEIGNPNKNINISKKLHFTGGKNGKISLD
tara:strand:- start:361 stop:516 length:156 start_codon:yes stop_codon:yes gene_type:complete